MFPWPRKAFHFSGLNEFIGYKKDFAGFYEIKQQHSLDNEEQNRVSELPNLKYFCHDTVLCDVSKNVLTPRTFHLDSFVTNKNIGKLHAVFFLYVCLFVLPF